jgi:hypothetical protein
MKIFRGTLRLSVVIALTIAIYYAFTGYKAATDADQESWRIWRTLRCGERFLDRDMSSYTSPYRPEVIDIGRAGCSNSSFWATFDEIRDAAARSEPEGLRFGEVFQFNLLVGLFNALAAFLAVNLLGFLFLGARSLFRWVRAGYQ